MCLVIDHQVIPDPICFDLITALFEFMGSSLLFFLLLSLEVIYCLKFLCEPSICLLFVLISLPTILRSDNDSRRDMGQNHTGFHLIDILTSFSSTSGVFLDHIFRINNYIIPLRRLNNSDCYCTGMDSTSFFCWRNTCPFMATRFAFKKIMGIIAL